MEPGLRVALERITLNNLNPNLGNVLIVGIIIGKQRPRKFTDPRTGMNRAVWNFTIRDSLRDYINVTYWGSSEVIFQANDKFRTGDVVEVVNPIITLRNLNDFGEQYRPMVTSPYNLTLSDRSSLLRHDGNLSNFLELLRIPTKPLAGYLPLREINKRGSTITDCVNILAVIKGMSPVRTVTSQNNETLKVRSVEVFDYSSPSLKIEIWENDIIFRSDRWRPRTTALYIADIKIQWSDFHRQFVAKVMSSTIITENPQGKEVEMLLNYARDAPIETFDILDQIITTLPDPNTIKDVMSVRQVHDKMTYFSFEDQFTGLLYAFVTKLDLDGLSKTLLIKCKKCKLEINGSRCENPECPTVFENEPSDNDFSFDIKISVTDHTGTLKNCRLSSLLAEQTLGCTAREFSNYSDEDKQSLKWKFLMERCVVYIAVLYVGNSKPEISVLKLCVANPFDVSRKLAIY